MSRYRGRQPRHSKVDTFQAEIAEIWRTEFGFSVFIASSVGQGLADTIVGVPGNDPRNELCEVKTGNASSTPAQEKFYRGWKGAPVWLIRSPGRAREWGRQQLELQQLRPAVRIETARPPG